mmetsp:Transcript_3236/g.1929  ORF Transcript_3236/g.1929 Transcript_3236/m.1929 type:complete len:100 (-) Transcript_3236:382-681(-)
MIVGNVFKTDGSEAPSSLIFHTKIVSEDRRQIMILTDYKGFQRPKYKPAKGDKIKHKIEYEFEAIRDEYMAKTYEDRSWSWLSLDDFLPDNTGLYKDLD